MEEATWGGRVRVGVFALALVTAGAGVTDTLAATQAEARNKAYAWLVRTQRGDGSWVDSSGTQSIPTALALQSMVRSGIRQGYVTGAATSWLVNKDNRSIDTLARQITALSAGGLDTRSLVTTLMNGRSLNEGGALLWGAYPGYSPSSLDTALALEALLSAGRSEASLTVSTLSGIRLSDGSWAYGPAAGGTHGDLIPTATVLQTLANYVVASPAAKASADSMATAAVSWLLARKKTDNGYADDAKPDGTHDTAKPGQVFETALVWSALDAARRAGFASAQAPNATAALASAESFLISKQQADGSWSGDALLTAGVLRIWSSSALADADRDGVPDTVEAVLGSNPNVADTRGLVDGRTNPLSPVPDPSADADVPTLPEWGALLLGSYLLLTLGRKPGRNRA